MKTKISYIETIIDYRFSEKFKLGGCFKPNKTNLMDDGTYHIVLGINLETNEISNLLQKIESIISHELNHAFVYVKNIDKKNKSNKINLVNKFTKSELNDLLNKNEPLKEFVKMIYLSNPLEIQTRVQQTASELKYINKKTSDETIEELLK